MGKAFDRIIIVMLENATVQDVLGNTYLNNLRKKGVFLSNSYGVTHSSQPNYILSVAGDNMGFANDTPGYAQWVYDNSGTPVTTIADLLEAKNLTWKNYAEDLPPGYVAAAMNGFPDTFPPETYPFARKHVPFLSFPDIITNPDRNKNITDAGELAADLASGRLPNYSWYSPNLHNDGHDLKPGQPETPTRIYEMANIEAFLRGFLSDDPIAKFPPRTLIVITFDEAYPYYDPYKVYTLLIGDMLGGCEGTTRTEPYNHYSLLRSVQENFALGHFCRNDATANPYWFL